MNSDTPDLDRSHVLFQQRIDASLMAGPSTPQDPSLQLHLQSCLRCRQYLENTSRVIASLGSFSFEVDPSLHARVSLVLEQRARQRQPLPRIHLAWVSIIAIALTLVGSLVEIRCGYLLASVFHVPRPQVFRGLLSLWIVPSLLPLLLFPALPLLAVRKESTL